MHRTRRNRLTDTGDLGDIGRLEDPKDRFKVPEVGATEMGRIRVCAYMIGIGGEMREEAEFGGNKTEKC